MAVNQPLRLLFGLFIVGGYDRDAVCDVAVVASEVGVIVRHDVRLRSNWEASSPGMIATRSCGQRLRLGEIYGSDRHALCRRAAYQRSVLVFGPRPPAALPGSCCV